MARFRANPSTGSGQASQEERHTHRFLSSHSFQITGGGGLVSPQLRASSDHCFIVGALRAMGTDQVARPASHFIATTIASGPTSGSTRVFVKPASRIHPVQSLPVKSKPPCVSISMFRLMSRPSAFCFRASSMRASRSEEHTSELQSPDHLVCRLLLEKKD